MSQDITQVQIEQAPTPGRETLIVSDGRWSRDPDFKIAWQKFVDYGSLPRRGQPYKVFDVPEGTVVSRYGSFIFPEGNDYGPDLYHEVKSGVIGDPHFDLWKAAIALRVEELETLLPLAEL